MEITNEQIYQELLHQRQMLSELKKEAEKLKSGDNLMTIDQSCTFLNIKKTLFYELMRAGNIHPTNIVGTAKRFTKKDLLSAKLYLKK